METQLQFVITHIMVISDLTLTLKSHSQELSIRYRITCLRHYCMGISDFRIEITGSLKKSSQSYLEPFFGHKIAHFLDHFNSRPVGFSQPVY